MKGSDDKFIVLLIPTNIRHIPTRSDELSSVLRVFNTKFYCSCVQESLVCCL